MSPEGRDEVLVEASGSASSGATNVGSGEAPLEVHRILVPVDFSPCSEAATHYARRLAARLGASIDVLHVWEKPQMQSPHVTIQVGDGPRQSLEEYALQQAATSLEKFLAGFPGSRPRMKGRIELGSPTETILTTAEEGGYDLIVMGTHGRSALAQLFMGSVAERVVRRAQCPVLTLHASPAEATIEVPASEPAVTTMMPSFAAPALAATG